MEYMLDANCKTPTIISVTLSQPISLVSTVVNTHTKEDDDDVNKPKLQFLHIS